MFKNVAIGILSATTIVATGLLIREKRYNASLEESQCILEKKCEEVIKKSQEQNKEIERLKKEFDDLKNQIVTEINADK